MPITDLLSPENYSQKVLPIAAIVESIATKGRSPGTTALKQQKYIEAGLERGRKAEQQALEAEAQRKERESRERTRELQRQIMQGNLTAAERKAQREGKQEEARSQKAEIFGNADYTTFFPELDPAMNELLRQYGRTDPEGFEREMLGPILGTVTEKPFEQQLEELRQREEVKQKTRAQYRPVPASQREPQGFGQGETMSQGAAAAVSKLGFGINKLQRLRNLVSSGDVTIFNQSGLFGGDFTNPEVRNLMKHLTELHGREQSGAAISSQEWKNFRDQVLNPKYLMTEAGRKTALQNLDDFIGRYYVQGRTITGDPEWYDAYQSMSSDAVQQFSGNQQPEQAQQTQHFDSVEAAEAANLPPGTIIYIKGRKAVIE